MASVQTVFRRYVAKREMQFSIIIQLYTAKYWQNIVGIHLMSGLKDKKLIKKANLHENWSLQILF